MSSLAMSPVVWAFLLLFSALVLLVIEMFVPSHGVIGAVAAVFVAAAIVAGFYQGVGWGVLMLAISAVSMPIAVWAVFMYWPHTPLGQRILIKLPESPDEVLPQSYRDTKSLVGKIGVARTKMLLSGAIEIDGKHYDAVSEDLPIEPGTEVQVVAVKMNRVIVRGLDPNRPRESMMSSAMPPVVQSRTFPAHSELPSGHVPNTTGASPIPAGGIPAGIAPEDLLARSAASFGLDELPELSDEAGAGDGEKASETANPGQ